MSNFSSSVQTQNVAVTAAVMTGVNEPLKIQPVKLSALQGTEILVEIKGSSICHTDVAALAGAMPIRTPAVLGHEGAGVVVAVGDQVRSLKPGDKVALSFDSCGSCDGCNHVSPAYCDEFYKRNYFGVRASDGSPTILADDGSGISGSWLAQSAFSTHVIATERSAVKVVSELPIEYFAPLGCGIQTGAGAVVNVAAKHAGVAGRKDLPVVIYGVGPVGIGALVAAVASGFTNVVVVDPLSERLELAKRLGANLALTPDQAAGKGLIEACGGKSAIVSIDTVSSEAVLDAAVAALAPGGICVTVGFKGPNHKVSLSHWNLLQGRTLRGALEGDSDPQVLIPQIIDWINNGTFPIQEIVTKIPFSQINDAIAQVAKGQVHKALLVHE